jgi:hypothetical protein
MRVMSYDELKAELAAKAAASVETGTVQFAVVPLGSRWRECVPADAASLIVSWGVDMETPGCVGCVAYTVWGKTPTNTEWVLQIIEVPAVPVAEMVF